MLFPSLLHKCANEEKKMKKKKIKKKKRKRRIQGRKQYKRKKNREKYVYINVLTPSLFPLLMHSIVQDGFVQCNKEH